MSFPGGRHPASGRFTKARDPKKARLVKPKAPAQEHLPHPGLHPAALPCEAIQARTLAEQQRQG